MKAASLLQLAAGEVGCFADKRGCSERGAPHVRHTLQRSPICICVDGSALFFAPTTAAAIDAPNQDGACRSEPLQDFATCAAPMRRQHRPDAANAMWP